MPETTRAGNLLCRIDVSLLLLIVILTVINIPYWDSQFMVGGDTKNTYLLFHYFYNHLMWYGELPQWLPFGEYGHSSLFFQVCNNSPCSYLAGFIGWVFRIKDTLALVKLAAFGDQLLFLLGLHLLSRLLYRHRITCFIICLLGIGSVVWSWQIYWGLRFFYLLPLALYFYYRFFAERLSWTFWATLLTLLFSLVGGLPYWAPIYFYLFLVMTLIMLPEQWRALGVLLRPGWRDSLLSLAVVICTVALGYLLTTCLDGLHNYSPGRQLNGMHTDLRTFLNYNTPNWQFIHAFFDGTMPEAAALLAKLPDDKYLYVGLLPVGAMVLALAQVRDRKFLSLFGGLVALVLLAGSGMSSWILYWVVPGMKSFRHLGLLLELGKILLLLSAGFGLDYLILRLDMRGWLEKHFSPFTYITLLAGLCFILDMLVSQMTFNPKSWSTPMQFTTMLPKGGEWTVVRLAVYGTILTVVFVFLRLPSLKKLLSTRVISGLLIVACLIDVGTFQCYQWLNRSQGSYVGRLELEPLKYFEARSWGMYSYEWISKAAIINSSSGTHHAFNANIIQYDPCVPFGQTALFSLGVHELVTARGGHPSEGMEFSKLPFLPLNDDKLMTVMGCNAPKLRFVSQAEYGKNNQEISNMIRFSKVLDSSVILRGDTVQQPVGRPMPDPLPMTYQATFFNANRLDLNVSVKQGFSGWLVYADAYDSHWKAYVNGNEKPVLEAYRAFKAVTLEGGDSRVSFRYENMWQKFAMSLLILAGILLSSGCIVSLVWQLFRGKRNTPIF